MAVLLPALLVGGLAACSRSPEKQLEAAYQRQEAAIEAASYSKVYDALCSKSRAMLDADIDMAKYGTASQVRSLAPSQVRRVMIIRNRMGAEFLESLDGPELIAWFFRREVYQSDGSRGLEVKSCRVTGDAGFVEIGLGRSAQNARDVADFILDRPAQRAGAAQSFEMPWVCEQGVWKYEMVAASRRLDETIARQAQQKGMSVSAFLEGMEREKSGGLRSDWDRAPLKRPGR